MKRVQVAQDETIEELLGKKQCPLPGCKVHHSPEITKSIQDSIDKKAAKEAAKEAADERKITFWLSGTYPKDAASGFLWDDYDSAAQYVVEDNKGHKIWEVTATYTLADMQEVPNEYA